jgi:hypothetical protein
MEALRGDLQFEEPLLEVIFFLLVVFFLVV